MKIPNISLHSALAALIFMAAASADASAAAPANFYKTCEGKSGQQLLRQLMTVVGPHTTVSYKSLYDVYDDSDRHPDGTIWDMYSTKNWGKDFNAVKCGNYSVVGDCINKEHSFPKSWFKDAAPMESDAYHIYPTDGKVNGQRGNYPYGECANGSYLASNGNVKPLGRLGFSTFPGFTGKVFEPDNEYKGDFARSYFYMAAAYNDRISTWSSEMLAGNAYPAFTSWAIELLLKWHRQDPVSEKEIQRNDAVSNHQHNRNPFIDHPEMAEHIWGNRIDVPWSSVADNTPAIAAPVSGTTIDLPFCLLGDVVTTKITLRGVSLPGDVTVSIAGQGFSVAPTSVGKELAMAGTNLEVSFTTTTAGEYTGTLTVKSGTLQSIVTLKVNAAAEIPPAPPLPSILFYFDSDLQFFAIPGVPSDPAELLIESDNVDYPLTLSVSAPFELSVNKQQWSTSISLDELQDRFYMRLNSSTEGSYVTTLKALSADGYLYDDVEIEGVVRFYSDHFLEDFEKQVPEGHGSSYAASTYSGSACDWATDNALFEYAGSNSFPHTGNQAVRFNKSGSRHITMLQDKPKGMGTLTFWARPWRADNADCSYDVSISADHGASWEKIGTVTAPANSGQDNVYTLLTLPIERPGNLRLKVEQTAGARSMLDDLSITDHEDNSALLTPMGHDYHSWDAYCVDGNLVLENADSANFFFIYSLDGRQVYAGQPAAGVTLLELPAGLYIVNVADFSRRVLVK